MRYNTEIYEVKVSVFIKLRRLQWTRLVICMNDEHTPKKALQQTIYDKTGSREAQEEMGRCNMGGLY
jgi:hypothetical protein